MALALRSMHAGLCARLSSIELSDIRYRTYRHGAMHAPVTGAASPCSHIFEGTCPLPWPDAVDLFAPWKVKLLHAAAADPRVAGDPSASHPCAPIATAQAFEGLRRRLNRGTQMYPSDIPRSREFKSRPTPISEIHRHCHVVVMIA